MSRYNDGTETRRRVRKAPKEFDGGWQGFVDMHLTDEDRVALDGYLARIGEDVWEHLETLVLDGYKVSITPVSDKSMVVVTLTGREKQNPNFGYSLTGRGPDLLGAMAAVLFKHVVVCEEGVWANLAPSRERQLPLFD